MAFNTTTRFGDYGSTENSLMEYSFCSCLLVSAYGLRSVVLVPCGPGNYINASAGLTCIDLLGQVVVLNCPQACLRVYEPAYLEDFSTEALDYESSKFLCWLESWCDEPEGKDEGLWLDARADLVRPVLFIAYGLGALLVSTALLQARSQGRAPAVTARTFGVIFLGALHSSDVERWYHASWSEIDYFSIDDRGRLELSGDFVRHVNEITNNFRQLFLPLYTFGSLRLHDCIQCSGSSTIHQEIPWSILSQSYTPHVVENGYNLPRDFSVRESRESFERALFCLSEAAVRHRNVRLSHKHERSLRHIYASEKLPDSCDWLFQEETYRRWTLSHGPACLWLHGQPGSGKTMLCSFMIQDLLAQEHFHDTVFFHVPYEYFRGTDVAHYVLDSFICQLSRKGRQMPSSKLLSIQKSVDMLESPVSSDAFRQHLAMILENLEPEARLLVALDELQNDEWIKGAFVHEIMEANIFRKISRQIRCVVTSEARHGVALHHDQIISMGIGSQVGVQRDIYLFAKARLAFHLQPTNEDPKLLERRARKLSLRANGNFLWVQMSTEFYGRTGQLDILRDVDALPSSLQGLYSKILQTVPASRINFVQKLLSWVLAAVRPLKLEELLEALIIEPSCQRASTNETFAMEKLGLQNPEVEIPQMCGGLVKITKHKLVTFTHLSIRDFLLNHNDPNSMQSNLLQAHKLLARTCLSLLEPEDRTIKAPRSVRSSPYLVEGARPASRLINYAIANWSTHYRIAEPFDQTLAGLVQKSLAKTVNHAYTYCSTSWKEPNFQIRFGASQGLLSLTQMYLEMGACPDGGSCPCCDTPLHLASARGHADVVALLLRNGASVFSATHSRGETALHLAAKQGSLNTIELLLNSSADVNAIDLGTGQTPLHAAAAFGHLKLVKLLMDYDVDINAALPLTQETPLHLAVLGGHLQVVKYMLGGISATSEELALYTSIVHKPYFQTWSENLVTEYGERAGFNDEMGQDALDDVGKMLSLSRKYADINIPTREGWTALHLAAFKGHDAVLQVLLRKGADIATKGKGQCTPLELAAENGHLSIVKHLIAAGADSNLDANRLGPLLIRIAEKGHHEISDLLMWKQFSAQVAGGTPKWPILHCAARSRQHTVQSAINRKKHNKTRSRRLPLG